MANKGSFEFDKFDITTLQESPGYAISVLRQYNKILRETAIGKNTLKKIKNDPRAESLKGKYTANGLAHQEYFPDLLAAWFLWFANETTIEEAEEALNLYLDSEEVSALEALWVYGIDVEEIVEISPYYEIRALDAMPDSDEKVRFSSFIVSDLGNAPAPQAAILYRRTVLKAVDNQEGSLPVSSDIGVLALLLNALSGVYCVPYLWTTYSDYGVPYGPFGATTNRGLLPSSSAGLQVTHLKEGSGEKIRKLLIRFSELNIKQKNRYLRVLHRLSRAKSSVDLADKILDLGIVLEMLLLTENPNNQQLTLTFKLRGSLLLDGTFEDKERSYKLLSSIYTLRSQVAHNGLLENGNIKKMVKVGQNFPEYQELTERIFRTLFLNGEPNWQRLILNGKR